MQFIAIRVDFCSRLNDYHNLRITKDTVITWHGTIEKKPTDYVQNISSKIIHWPWNVITIYKAVE